MSRKRRKAATLERSRVLADTMLNAIRHGNLFEHIAEAGRRIKRSVELYDQLCEAIERYETDPTSNQTIVDGLEEQFVVAQEFRAMEHTGIQQREIMKTLVFSTR